METPDHIACYEDDDDDVKAWMAFRGVDFTKTLIGVWVSISSTISGTLSVLIVYIFGGEMILDTGAYHDYTVTHAQVSWRITRSVRNI